MKKKLLILLLLSPFYSFSQWNPEGPGYLYFEKVYEVEMEKEEIKKATNEWIAVTYNSPETVTKLSTSDKTIISPSFEIHTQFNGYSFPNNVTFDLTAEFKEGRYRLRIDNIYLPNSVPVATSEMMDFTAFKKAFEETAANLTGAAKKEHEKLLKNEKKLKKMYDDGIGMQNQIQEKVKSYLENNMINSLNNYVKNYKEDSDW